MKVCTVHERPFELMVNHHGFREPSKYTLQKTNMTGWKVYQPVESMYPKIQKLGDFPAIHCHVCFWGCTKMLGFPNTKLLVYPFEASLPCLNFGGSCPWVASFRCPRLIAFVPALTTMAFLTPGVPPPSHPTQRLAVRDPMVVSWSNQINEDVEVKKGAIWLVEHILSHCTTRLYKDYVRIPFEKPTRISLWKWFWSLDQKIGDKKRYGKTWSYWALANPFGVQ